MKRIAFIAICVFLTISLAACGSASDKVVKHLAKGDYASANKLYWEKVDGNSVMEDEVFSAIEERLNSDYEALNSGKKKYADAIVMAEAVSKCDFLYSWQTEKIVGDFEELQESKENFLAGQKAFESGNYLEAMNRFDSVSNTDSNYLEAKQQKKEALNSYKLEIALQAQELANEGDYLDAAAILWETIELVETRGGLSCDDLRGQHSEYLKILQEQADRKLVEEAKQLAADGKYSAALTQLYQNSSEIVRQEYQQILRGYVNQYLDNAQSTFENEANAEGALTIVDVGMAGLPEIPEAFLKAYAYYENYCPKLLANTVEIKKSESIIVGKSNSSDLSYSTDNYGNTHQSIVHLSISSYIGGWGKVPEAEYNVSKYDRFSGTIYIPQYYRNGDGKIEVQILIDGIQVFDSGIISKGSEPVDFNIDLSEATKMTIRLSGTTGSIMNPLEIYLGETYFSCDITGKTGFTERM